MGILGNIRNWAGERRAQEQVELMEMSAQQPSGMSDFGGIGNYDFFGGSPATPKKRESSKRKR